jgi:hypothetical protein
MTEADLNRGHNNKNKAGVNTKKYKNKRKAGHTYWE